MLANTVKEEEDWTYMHQIRTFFSEAQALQAKTHAGLTVTFSIWLLIAFLTEWYEIGKRQRK